MTIIEFVDKHWSGISWFAFTMTTLALLVKAYVAHKITTRINR